MIFKLIKSTWAVPNLEICVLQFSIQYLEYDWVRFSAW